MNKAIEALSEVRKSLDGTEVTSELRAKVLSVLDETIVSLSSDVEVANAALSASKDEQIDKLNSSLKNKAEELSEKNKMIEKLSAAKAELDKKLEEYALKEKQERVNSLLEKEIQAGVTKAEEKDARYSDLMSKDIIVLSEVEKVVNPLVTLSNRQSVPSTGIVQKSSDAKSFDGINFKDNGDVISATY